MDLRQSVWRQLLSIAVIAIVSRAGAQTLDARFLQGLRERRLFELAEAYCADRLRRAAPREASQAELTVELVRTLSLHAVNLTPADRDALWTKAHVVAADFLRQSPPHPRAILVRLQDALTLLAQGELARQELEAGALPAQQIEPARQALRQATTLLESLDKELKAEIPQRRRAGPRAGELSADELANLAAQVQHQLGRAERNRALLFEPGSNDRLSLLLAAADTFGSVMAQIASDNPLRVAVALDLALCQRLLGRYAEAAQLARELDHDGVEPQARLLARAELIRGAIGQSDFAAAQRLLEQGRMIGGQASAELDFAWFEALLAFARAARQGQRPIAEDRGTPSELAKKYEQQAADAARQLEETHGPSWGRRASQLLIAAVPRGSLASVELLSRAADSLYLKGDLDQALAAYDDAAGQARKNGDTKAAFELAYKAALVEQKREHYADAANRLRILARGLPTYPLASEAHLLAAWNTAQAARNEPAAADAYEELLAEHLAMWPMAESADQARIWLGKVREDRSNWSAAIEAYAGISRASPHYATAIAALARCWRAELAALEAAGKPPAEPAIEAIRFFKGAVTGPDNRWPQRWTEADRTAALAAAELIVAYQPGSASDAEELLRRALAGALEARPEWRIAAQAQLVIALAAQGGRQNDALAELRAIGAASADPMLAVLEGLSQIAGRSTDRARGPIARVQLAAVDMLAQSRDKLTREQQLTLDRVQAEGLAALGSREKALQTYAALASRNPDNAAVQEGYARLLLDSTNPAELKRALDQWRTLAAHTRPRTPQWYEAKYSVALTQFKLGDVAGAATLLRYMLETPPGLSGTGWDGTYRALLAKCSR